MKSKRLILGLLMSIMMVFAMIPSIASADTTFSINQPVSEIVVGQTQTLTASGVTSGNHVDWTVTNGTGAATISVHRGVLNPTSAGTVTVTANLMEGTAPTGTGGGTGGPCEGTPLATATITLDIHASSGYGFQGLGGNTMKLLSPSDITLAVPATTVDGGVTTYHNVINDSVSLEDDVATFGYTMSAGINNFSETTFNTYKSQIRVLATDGEVISTAEFKRFVSPEIEIEFENLSPNTNYILQFGPNVCGNNPNKKLGCYIEFTFTTGAATQVEE